MVATTLVTVFLSHAFPRDPALQPLSFVFTFVPRPSLKILSPVATHPPSREISSLGDIAPPLPPPREKFKRGGNLRDSLPPPPSSWNKRGTAQSRQKISKSLDKGVLETPSLPPSLPPFLSSYLLLSVQVATAGLRGNGRGNFGRCFLYICRGVELTKEQVFGMKFCSTARSTGGRSPGLTRLDIDFVKMPDRHHLYGRRVSGGGGEGGLDDLLGIDVVDVLFPPSLPPSVSPLLEMLSGFNVWLSSMANEIRLRRECNSAICISFKNWITVQKWILNFERYRLKGGGGFFYYKRKRKLMDYKDIIFRYRNYYRKEINLISLKRERVLNRRSMLELHGQLMRKIKKLWFE